MKVAPENIFPGARIKSGETMLTVIKVNQKTFYASEMCFSEYMEKFNSRPKGVTFTAFCKAYDIKSYAYSQDFEIDDNEAKRKNAVEENSKDIFKLESWERADIIKMVNFFDEKKKSIRLFQFESRNKTIRFLERKDNSFLINFEGNYILLCLDTGECVKIATVYDYKNKYEKIPWEKLSNVQEEQLIEKIYA